MKQYTATEIRNIVLAGHGGAGKTSLAEAMLFTAKATDRLGKVADGNTVFDSDPEEIKRRTSVSTAVAPAEWQNCKINIIDVPGLFDFEGGLYEGMRAADCAALVVSGKSGCNVGTEKGFKAATKRGLPKFFFITKVDEENADFFRAYESLKAAFGTAVCPVVVPVVDSGKLKSFVNVIEMEAYSYEKGVRKAIDMPDLPQLDEIHTAISEAIAETSEELMDKYFAGEPFTPDEIKKGLAAGVKSGTISPVFCGSNLTLEGIDLFMDGIVSFAPSALEAAGETAMDANGDPIDLSVDDTAPTAVVIFKTVADPFVGKLSYFKVISGKMTPESILVNSRTGANEKIGKLMMIKGKKQSDVQFVGAGDIGAVAKLGAVRTGDTLSAPARTVTLLGVDFPNPVLSMAVAPKTKGDEDKVAAGLTRLKEEDPTLSLENNKETHQLVLSGLGEQHLDVIASKLKNKFGVDITLTPPRVPYRETIRKKVKVQGRHKKQTGGHGQFGDVWIEFEPCDSDDLVFEEKVFGGSVPRNFFPAVEKGLRDCVQAGILAGYPVVGLKATLVDGSYHPVDSSEMSFKMAATLAYKAGLTQATPVLLEPIGNLKVYIPEDNMGDIIGEANKRRGRVLGMSAEPDGLQMVEAEAPMAELYDFSTYLRQVTQGRGNFTLDFCRYEEAPSFIAQKVIDSVKAGEDAS